MLNVSVVLPTFNEKGNIITLIELIAAILKRQVKSFEIIVVDDDSPDGTGIIVQNYSRSHTFVHGYIRKKDHGLGKSIGFGVNKSKGKIIIGMDADFNHDPATIPHLLLGLKKADLVVASRFVSGGGMEEKWRLFPTLIFNLCFKALGFPIFDNTSGFYAINKIHLLHFGLEQVYYGHGDYHLRLLMCAKKQGLKIIEVPTYYPKRLTGRSKSNLTKMAVDYLEEAVRLSHFLLIA